MRHANTSTVWPNALARHFQAQVIQARERAQVGAIKGSIGHVEVFQMDGVGISIIGRPRPLPGHDTPNPANNTAPSIMKSLFSGDEHIALEVTWSVYQNIIDAYRAPDTSAGKALMQAEIDRLSDADVPRSLTEIITLGRTLKRRAGDILAYFDHPHTSNGPTEAINGRLEHLRGSALGFRNLTHYITRCLLETGGFRPQLHPQL